MSGIVTGKADGGERQGQPEVVVGALTAAHHSADGGAGGQPGVQRQAAETKQGTGGCTGKGGPSVNLQWALIGSSLGLQWALSGSSVGLL